jgi:pilus assembly protein Flp/PilA
MMNLFDVIALVKSLYKDGRGVTALEYGLIAGAISLAIVASVNSLGTKIGGVFGNLANGTW